MRRLLGRDGRKAAEAIVEIALGTAVGWVTDKFGIEYQVRPTLELRFQALTWAYERLNGKTPTPIEVSGPQGGPISLEAMAALPPERLNEFIDVAARITGTDRNGTAALGSGEGSESEAELAELREAGLEPS